MPGIGDRTSSRTMWILGAVVWLLITAVFAEVLFGLVSNGGEALASIVGGRTMKITSQEQFESAMMCLYQRALGCDKIEYGSWVDVLDGTVLANCPCGGDFVAGTEIRGTVDIGEGGSLSIGSDFAGFSKIFYWENDCSIRFAGENTAGVLGQRRELVLHNFKEDGALKTQEDSFSSEVIPHGSQIVMVVNSRKGLIDRNIQGCIEIG